MSLTELKVQLKKWETDFFEQTGKKPTKEDITTDSAAKSLYIKYARLKNAKTIESTTAAVNSSIGVWGKSLLKTNKPEIIDDSDKLNEHFQETPPDFSLQDKLRKNIGFSNIKSLPTSLRKIKPLNLSKSSSECIPSQKVCNNKKLIIEDYNTETHSKIQIRVAQQKHNNKSAFSFANNKNHQIVSRPVKLSWLNENEEDLSDLANLECRIKEEHTIEKSSVQSSKVADEHISNNSASKSVTNVLENKTSMSNKPTIASDSIADELMSTSGPLVEKNHENENKINIDKVVVVTTKCDSSSISSKSVTVNKPSASLVSNNFVRVNMKQKTFCRRSGKGKFLRKQLLKEKMMKKGCSFRSGWKGRNGGAGKRSFRNKAEDKCYKCGKLGHWANNCSNIDHSATVESMNEDHLRTTESISEILENFHEPITESASFDSASAAVGLKQADSVYSESSYDRDEVLRALNKFGFSEFRPDQEKAVKRILCGKSTLVVLSTGLGKSLCYQLPAYLYALKHQSITLVVSPLVSLMDDQVSGLPKFLKASRLHSGMTKEQRESVLSDIESGKVTVLLLSPEALTSWAGMPPHISPLCRLPPISFVCIDECHCLSEWSHSFRPSYLRVCQVLKDQLGIECLLGLTATATGCSSLSICKQLDITDQKDGVIMNVSLPSNLLLSVSIDIYKDEALEVLLNSSRFKSLDSIIIYCTRRDEAARLSAFIRTRLQNQQKENELFAAEEDVIEEPNNKKRKRQTSSKNCKRRAVTWEADCYHAGMSAAERRRVQNRFMKGQLRIVVATVAFGMGIDKQNVRAVIHYNMPRSFERYVQEVGRAGRDGLPAYCHLLLNTDGGDLSELSRHTYAKTVDRYTVKRLVEKVFQPCSCSRLGKECKGHLSAIPIDSAVVELDLAKEGIETLLCYLEVESLIKVLLPSATVCRIHCYEGPQQLMKSAKKCHAVALAISDQGKEECCSSEVEFSVVKIATKLQQDFGSLKRNLLNLVWDTTLSSENRPGKSGITVEFKHLSFLVQSKREYSDQFLDDTTSFLHDRVLSQEKKELGQLRACFDTMHKFSYANVDDCIDKSDILKSDQLKRAIGNYFKEEHVVSFQTVVVKIDESTETDIRATVRQFLSVHGSDLDRVITGRAIARILHGIESPCYPAKTWGSARRFWRSKIHVDFNAIVKIATEEILNMR